MHFAGCLLIPQCLKLNRADIAGSIPQLPELIPRRTAALFPASIA